MPDEKHREEVESAVTAANDALRCVLLDGWRQDVETFLLIAQSLKRAMGDVDSYGVQMAAARFRGISRDMAERKLRAVKVRGGAL